MSKTATAAAFVSALSLAAFAGDNPNFSTHLTGANELPARETPAQGQALFHVSQDGLSIDYRLMVANIENVNAAHIHLGGSTVNGPVVVGLFSGAPGGGRTDGVLAEGTFTAAHLVGPLAGKTIADLVAAMAAGNTYVNVHTNDGVDPANTGAGDFPGGEIRGQI